MRTEECHKSAVAWCLSLIWMALGPELRRNQNQESMKLYKVGFPPVLPLLKQKVASSKETLLDSLKTLHGALPSWVTVCSWEQATTPWCVCLSFIAVVSVSGKSVWYDYFHTLFFCRSYCSRSTIPNGQCKQQAHQLEWVLWGFGVSQETLGVLLSAVAASVPALVAGSPESWFTLPAGRTLTRQNENMGSFLLV